MARLEPLARAVFGQGQRPQGWFARKLHRECVDGPRSQLLTRSADPRDPEAWVGYALLGQPPSLAPVLRTAGIGLLPSWRGRGLGQALVAALIDTARHGGAAALHIPSSVVAQPFYRRCGLRPRDSTLTLLAFGRGPASSLPPPEPWAHDPPGPQRSGWLREAWERTEPQQRGTWRLCEGRHRLDVSMEGSAQVAMRWTSTEPDTTGIDAWLDRVATGAPALLHGLPERACVHADLEERGWTVVQRTITMEARWPASP